MKKVAIFLAALAMAIPGSIADAQSGSGVRLRITYHMDAGFSSPVGEFVEFCDGSYTWNGEITEHGQYQLYEC